MGHTFTFRPLDERRLFPLKRTKLFGPGSANTRPSHRSIAIVSILPPDHARQSSVEFEEQHYG
jgi:hypothetical protein